jgi:Rps23 Pro-64 3,4-dihydroxylase Tpa1-like proline 4-hydroxylase
MYLSFRNFLSADLLSDVRRTTLAQRERFCATTVTSGEAGHRQSQVLWHYSYPALYAAVSAALRGILPDIRARFPQMPVDPVIELQMTGHGDGDYFRRHRDNACAATQHRVLTYVYYYTLSGQKRFKGGELRFDDGSQVVPEDNVLVVFPADWYHEVLPISLHGNHWADWRMTLNGWFAPGAGRLQTFQLSAE